MSRSRLGGAWTIPLWVAVSVPAAAAPPVAAAPSQQAESSAPGSAGPDAAATPPAAARPAEAVAPGASETASFAAASCDVPEDSAVHIKLYGDTEFGARDHAVVHDSFAAAHLDLFTTADFDKLSFLAETFFEAGEDNEFAVDVERVQLSYLFANWLRVRAGRTHTAFGYYNDTYHHGNLFELTTGRPHAVNFEDDGGIFVAHLVGVGIDGTFDTANVGSFRYDLEAGNGRLRDISAVAVDHAEKDDKMVNLRLRWLPLDGLILGVNLLRDQIPGIDAVAPDPGRPKLNELIGGAHVVYMEHGFHVLLEGYVIDHKASGGGSFTTRGGFAELGYAFGEVTPYARGEVIRFPAAGDPVYQAAASPYAGTRSLGDLRFGVRYQPLPALALKLEGARLNLDSFHQESATIKAAFGF